MKDYYVHESSYVDRGARVGKGTTIWYFCHVREGAVIGERCNIGQNVYIGKNVRIGNNVKIQNNVSVYEKVTLEDDVFCGPSAVFTNDMDPRSAVPKDPETEHIPTLVRKGATLGANVTIVCGNTIGRYAFVGAGAVVTRHVPDHGLVYGNPARLRGWVCECGFKLGRDRGKGLFRCRRCGKRYRGTMQRGLKQS